MEKLLKIPYKVFNDWDLLQQFLDKKGNPIYELVGSVYLRGRTNIIDLGSLVRVDGNLYLQKTTIISLGNLEYVVGNLFLNETTIESLGNLKFVGGTLNLIRSSIKSLGNLEYVGGEIYLSRDHQIPEEELSNFKIEYY